ncbi:MAG TPA: DUF4870 domain-containing protein [Streptosporangiaceae bacterium]|jgi:hypothetical protein
MSQEWPEGTPGGQSGGGESGGGPYGQWPPAADPGQQNGSPFAQQNGSPFPQQNGSPFAHQNGTAAPQNGPAPAAPYALPGQEYGYPGATAGPGMPVAGPAGYGPRPQSDDRAWATVAYLTPFVVSFLGPLIIYLIKKNESPFIRHHAAQALNMIITVTAYSVILLGLGTGAAADGHGALFVLAFLLWIILGFVYLVFLIIATVGANRADQPYQVPGWMCFRLVR